MPSIIFDLLVNITWDGCSNIKVSSIAFTLLSDFMVPLVLFSEKHSWCNCPIFQLLATVKLVVVQL